MVISLTMDIEINTTANYTLKEIALVHMLWANVFFKAYPHLTHWYFSEKRNFVLNKYLFLL